jgi:hypothetical protein
MTRAEAIKQALENLRVIDAISNPSAEDTVTVGKRLDQVRAELSEIGLVWWTFDAIPDAVAGAFCELVAEASQSTFGKTYSAPGARSRIAAVKSSAQREPQRADYF